MSKFNQKTNQNLTSFACFMSWTSSLSFNPWGKNGERQWCWLVSSSFPYLSVFQNKVTLLEQVMLMFLQCKVYEKIIIRGVVMERYDMTLPLLFFSYPGGTQTEEVRRKADRYKLLLMMGMREKDRKGRAALWWHYQTTQTEPEDFSLIFRGLVHLVRSLFSFVSRPYCHAV